MKKINNKKFLQYIENTIDRLIDFKFEGNEIESLCEIFREKLITVENVSFIYPLMDYYNKYHQDETIKKEFKYIKKILDKTFTFAKFTLDREETHYKIELRRKGNRDEK